MVVPESRFSHSLFIIWCWRGTFLSKRHHLGTHENKVWTSSCLLKPQNSPSLHTDTCVLKTQAVNKLTPACTQELALVTTMPTEVSEGADFDTCTCRVVYWQLLDIPSSPAAEESGTDMHMRNSSARGTVAVKTYGCKWIKVGEGKLWLASLTEDLPLFLFRLNNCFCCCWFWIQCSISNSNNGSKLPWTKHTSSLFHMTNLTHHFCCLTVNTLRKKMATAGLTKDPVANF